MDKVDLLANTHKEIISKILLFQKLIQQLTEEKIDLENRVLEIEQRVNQIGCTVGDLHIDHMKF